MLITNAKFQQISDLLEQDLHWRQIVDQAGISRQSVYNVKREQRRKQATCPICGKQWELKGGAVPSAPVAEYIAKNGCSDCLVLYGEKVSV